MRPPIKIRSKLQLSESAAGVLQQQRLRTLGWHTVAPPGARWLVRGNAGAGRATLVDRPVRQRCRSEESDATHEAQDCASTGALFDPVRSLPVRVHQAGYRPPCTR
jgi:ABC-type molybdenum transport system ATPase subunit/photorepair protein PhrA